VAQPTATTAKTSSANTQPTTVPAQKAADQKSSQPSTKPPSAQGAIDACKLLSEAEIAAAVGNPVEKGEYYAAGTEVCRWDTEEPDHVSVLLTVRGLGSDREKILCADLRGKAGSAQQISGVGEVATWEFSSMGTLFNSGDIESCGAKGFISLSLNGKADEATLKQAALTIIGKVMSRL
jgi:hypothetical protein